LTNPRASDLPDFSDLIRAAADHNGMSAHMVEKDYYVTRALNALTALLPQDAWVFKGGTSLSKAFHLIHRFSEDVDLLFVASGSNRVREERLKRAVVAVKNALGTTEDQQKSHERGFALSTVIPYSVSVAVAGASVVREGVLLEMGYRGNPEMCSPKRIRSIISDYIAHLGLSAIACDLAGFDVPTLAPQRTFVEKLFAIHSAFDVDKAATKMRHYYDIYCLLALPEVRAFIGTPEYWSAVADALEISSRFFGVDAARFRGFSESPALKPSDRDREALRRNYGAERELYYVEPPSIDDILARIGEVALSL